MPSMQAKSEGKVKYDNKKNEYKCPCPEKVCNYHVFARVKCTVCPSAIHITRRQNGSFTHAKEGIYVVASFQPVTQKRSFTCVKSSICVFT